MSHEQQHDLDQGLDELTQRWVHAEIDADVPALDSLVTDDFTLVGPLGFVLDRAQWLDRYRSGDLSMRSLRWEDTRTRRHGSVAITVGRLTQQASHRGSPADGTFRVTQIVLDEGAGPRLAGLHYSPLAERAGAPAR